MIRAVIRGGFGLATTIARMSFRSFKFARPLLRSPARHGRLLRSLTYATTEARLARGSAVAHCTSLDALALSHWRHGWQPVYPAGAPAAHWDWPKLLRPLLPDPYRFDIAVWGVRSAPGLGGAPPGWELCGLAVGQLSNRRRIVRVSHVAASPRRDHPLKGHVLEAVAIAAEAYGNLWLAHEVHFEDPLPGARRAYELLGYDLVLPGAGKSYWGTTF